jgi:hypothetical protein
MLTLQFSNSRRLSNIGSEMSTDIHTLPRPTSYQSRMNSTSHNLCSTSVNGNLTVTQTHPNHITNIEESCGEPLPPLRIKRYQLRGLERWKKTGEVHRQWPSFKQCVLNCVSLTAASVHDRDDNIRRPPTLFCDIFRRADGRPKFPGLIVCHHSRNTLERAKNLIESDIGINTEWLQPVCPS